MLSVTNSDDKKTEKLRKEHELKNYNYYGLRFFIVGKTMYLISSTIQLLNYIS